MVALLLLALVKVFYKVHVFFQFKDVLGVKAFGNSGNRQEHLIHVYFTFDL